MNLAFTLYFPSGQPLLASLAVFKSSLRSLYRGLAGDSAADVRPMQHHSLRQLPKIVAKPAASRAYSIREKCPCDHTKSPSWPPTKPALRVLRVLRVHEAGQTQASVGRMVISGRMADVCAELDRLALQEAQVLAAMPSR
jgi:hypothetical protein